MAKKDSSSEKEELKAMTLKMFPSMYEQIDDIRTKQGGISRNAWIRQAIVEKLDRDTKKDETV